MSVRFLRVLIEPLRLSQAGRRTRAGIAILCVLVSGGLSSIGVVDLIAKGYGTMAWGFLVLYVGPLLTVGIYRLMCSSSKPAAEVGEGSVS